MQTVTVIERYFVFTEGKQTYRGKLIKLSKQLVQQFNQFLGCALGGQAGEADYICKQDAATERVKCLSECRSFISASSTVYTRNNINWVPDQHSSQEFVQHDISEA